MQKRKEFEFSHGKQNSKIWDYVNWCQWKLEKAQSRDTTTVTHTYKTITPTSAHQNKSWFQGPFLSYPLSLSLLSLIVLLGFFFFFFFFNWWKLIHHFPFTYQPSFYLAFHILLGGLKNPTFSKMRFK